MNGSDRALCEMGHIKESRQAFLDEQLIDFITQRNGKPLLYSKSISTLINNFYWRIVEEYIRPKMKHPEGRIDFHKIIAATEYSIVALNLLRYEDFETKNLIGKVDEETSELNADFAMHVALRMFERLFRISSRPISHRGNFIREHKTWLMNQQPDNISAFPLFLLAQLWWAIQQINLIFIY